MSATPPAGPATPPAGGLQISQGFTVLPPRSVDAYPVSCDEWKFLKNKLSSVDTPPWILPAISFTLLGAALATVISIRLGGVAPGAGDAAWYIVATTGSIGIACLGLSIKSYRMDRTVVKDVVRQMELIEKRFEG